MGRNVLKVGFHPFCIAGIDGPSSDAHLLLGLARWEQITVPRLNIVGRVSCKMAAVNEKPRDHSSGCKRERRSFPYKAA